MKQRRSTRGVTLVEMVLIFAILFAIISITTPAFISTKRRGEDAACLSHIRQTSLALSLYVSDYDSCYPSVVAVMFDHNHAQSDQTWRDGLVPYLKSPHFPQCPLAQPSPDMTTKARLIDICGYAYNQRLNPIDARTHHIYFGRNDTYVRYPSITVSIFDAPPGILALKEPDTSGVSEPIRGIWRSDLTGDIMSFAPGALRHHGGAHYAFVDGHVKWLSPDPLNTDIRSDGIRPGFGL